MSENKKNRKSGKNDSASKKRNFSAVISSSFATLRRWTVRMVMGSDKEMAMMDITAVENLESPTRMAVRTFFRRKLAVVALIVLVSLFLFVFIGSLLLPMDINYNDPLQANISPNCSMLRIPRALSNNVKDINGFSNFTIGVSKDNTLYIWGNTKDALSKVDYSDFPEEIKVGNVYMAAAGSDHIIAITTDGAIVGWGDKSRAQYGDGVKSEKLVYMPDELKGEIDITKVQQLICGYQCTALVYDGRLYMWGNGNTIINLQSMLSHADEKLSDGIKVKKVALSNYYGLILYEDGSIASPSYLNSKTTVTSSKGEKVKLGDVKNVVDVVATNNCFALLSDSGEIFVQGSSEYGESSIASIPKGQKAVSLAAGTRHIVALTDANEVYAWGHNDYGQTSVNGKSAKDVFVGSKQTYLVDEDDDITVRVGLRGYFFGTDKFGRDTFTRIVHGGKMTMTVGAVAVVVSTIIAVIVGCLSGYFGGWVDILLMRFTEICSAIPFLPFAMMLSYVIQKNPISETNRIIIIMIILGLLSWTGLARIIRAQVLAEREKEFVTAAKSMGIKERRIAFRHILPNVISVILVSVTLDFAGCLLTESSLSYLGFGVQQPRPTWGNMLNGANNSVIIQNYWWQWVFPAIFLAIATISINIVGDTLRDVLDPKSSVEK